MTQAEKAQRFLRLHQENNCFVIANAWDAGSAKMLAFLGFKALATSSGAHAGTLGRVDGQVSRDEAISHARAIVEATDLPVSADLEKGFGDSEGDVARTVADAAAAGLVGCSIEDATGDPAHPIYVLEHAVARVAAAVRAAEILPFPFLITARAENFLRGRVDLDDTVNRLKGFERVGAHVLMAPGLPDLASVQAVCAAVSKPVNFMAGIKGKSFAVTELAAVGVKRVSLATSLFRAAMGGARAAATEVLEHGTFHYLDRMVQPAEWGQYMSVSSSD